MIHLNGSQGEGGGQILRSALCLSLLTQRPFRIHDIRKTRDKPGLLRQHLTAVAAAQAISGAQVSGDALGSTELSFSPGPVRPGDYCFDIESAGSTVLVLQSILPALALGAAASTVRLKGGTHNPMAPSVEFMAHTLAPQLRALGWQLDLELVRAGFYPAGRGELVARIGVASKPAQPFALHTRGELLFRRATALLAHVRQQVGEREVAQLQRRLGWRDDECSVRSVDSAGSGNTFSALLGFTHVTECFTAHGEKGVTAECVANDVASPLRDYQAATAPVGEHLCDQLLLPLAVTGGGSFTATAWTPHSESQRALLQQFIEVPVRTEQTAAGVVVTVGSVHLDSLRQVVNQPIR